MKKADSLRDALTRAFPDEFASDPQRLSLWIEEGHVRCHAGMNGAGADNLNYSIEYKLCISIAGWRLSSLLIWIVVIDWLRVHQPELLTPAQSRKAIPFEADLVSNVEVDIGFDLMLTEAVRVTRRPDGGFDMRVVDEPDPLFPDAAPLLCSAPLLKQIFAPGESPEQITPDLLA